MVYITRLTVPVYTRVYSYISGVCRQTSLHVPMQEIRIVGKKWHFLFFILFFIFLFFTPLPGMHIHIYLESATRLYMIYISKHYYNTSNISLARLSYTLPTYN